MKRADVKILTVTFVCDGMDGVNHTQSEINGLATERGVHWINYEVSDPTPQLLAAALEQEIVED